VRVLYTVKAWGTAGILQYEQANRRLIAVPLVLLSLMTPKVRSQSRSGKSPTTSGSKVRSEAERLATGPLQSPNLQLKTPASGVESTLKGMSVEEKVGQLLFTTYHGSFTPTDTTALRRR